MTERGAFITGRHVRIDGGGTVADGQVAHLSHRTEEGQGRCHSCPILVAGSTGYGDRLPAALEMVAGGPLDAING